MRLTRAIQAIALLVLLSGCGGSHPWRLPALFAPHAASDAAAEQRQPSQQRQVDTLLTNNDFAGALETIEAAVAQGAAESDFAAEYPRALNGVLQRALALQEQNNPLPAGLLYRAARTAYPRGSTLRDGAAMTLTEIDTSLELCANALLAEGLQAYRKGDLQEAIAIWESIARFHPDHQASQRAIATTRTQLANLKRLAEE